LRLKQCLLCSDFDGRRQAL